MDRLHFKGVDMTPHSEDQQHGHLNNSRSTSQYHQEVSPPNPNIETKNSPKKKKKPTQSQPRTSPPPAAAGGKRMNQTKKQIEARTRLNKHVLEAYKRQVFGGPNGEAPTMAPERTVPPSFLAPTASPYAWVANAALEAIKGDYEDKVLQEQSANKPTSSSSSSMFHPRMLFQEAMQKSPHKTTSSPNSTSTSTSTSTTPSVPTATWPHALLHPQCTYAYLSPKLFHHEPPPFHWSIPEVAFLGRSNVGKSSLINALTSKKSLLRGKQKQQLAITSKRPGRTRMVNYFGIFPPHYQQQQQQQQQQLQNQVDVKPQNALGYLIDLPGFGYAAAPDKEVDTWQRQTMDFLLHRRHGAGGKDHPSHTTTTTTNNQSTLCRVYFLIDARRGILDFDRVVMGWFDEAAIPYTIVLTKIDAAVSKAMAVRYANEACMRFHAQVYSKNFKEEEINGRGGGGGMYGYDDDDDDDDDDDGMEEDLRDSMEEGEQNGMSSGGSQGPIVHFTSARTGAGIAELMWAIEGDFLAFREELKEERDRASRGWHWR